LTQTGKDAQGRDVPSADSEPLGGLRHCSVRRRCDRRVENLRERPRFMFAKGSGVWTTATSRSLPARSDEMDQRPTAFEHRRYRGNLWDPRN